MSNPLVNLPLNRRQFLLTTGGSLLVAGCVGKPDGDNPSAGPAIAPATDGRSRVKLFPGWQVQADLNENAELQIGDLKRQRFLIVLTELKQDFADDVTYRDHARMTLTTFQKSFDAVKNMGDPKELVINKKSAVQHEFTAVAKRNKARFYYLHTTVDGTKAFHQLLAWTLFSRIDENRAGLAAAIGSFEDLS